MSHADPISTAPKSEPASDAGPAAPAWWRGPLFTWALLALVLFLAGSVRSRVTGAPLERDEGEYAYMGQLMLQGVPPYAEAYNMKLPGIYVAYAAVLAVFGETREGIHQGLLVVNAFTTVLVFLLARRLLARAGALVAASAFAFLSLSYGVQGVFANAEHFVLPPAVAGLWFLHAGVQRGRLAWIGASGFLLGLAFVVKQHGIAFPAFGGVYLLAEELRRRPRDPRGSATRLGVFALAAALPFGIACAWLAFAGVFDTFWFWCIRYAREYASQRPLSELPKHLFAKGRIVMREAPLLWALVPLGLSALLWDRVSRRHALFLGLLALFSFLAITPGLHFRPHYWVLLLPAAALAIGLLVEALARVADRLGRVPALALAALAFLVPLGHAVRVQSPYLFELPPRLVPRAVFGLNPFYEAVTVANYIAEYTDEDDRIAVIGSEPQIYFYSRRRSASGFLYVYALMENHPYAPEMHRQMIAEIEESEPEFLVYVKVRTSWLMTERSHKELLQWAERYKQDFELVAVMDMRTDGATFYHGPSLKKRPDKTDDTVEVWRRRR